MYVNQVIKTQLLDLLFPAMGVILSGAKNPYDDGLIVAMNLER